MHTSSAKTDDKNRSPEHRGSVSRRWSTPHREIHRRSLSDIKTLRMCTQPRGKKAAFQTKSWRAQCRLDQTGHHVSLDARAAETATYSVGAAVFFSQTWTWDLEPPFWGALVLSFFYFWRPPSPQTPNHW
jgi:hypothetical protein